MNKSMNKLTNNLEVRGRQKWSAFKVSTKKGELDSHCKAISSHRDQKPVSEKEVIGMPETIYAPAFSRFFSIKSTMPE